MKKIIVLLLCLLGGSSLFAQENTVLGTGALSQASTPKYAIQDIQIVNPGSYSRPTIDFGSHTVQLEYQDMYVTQYGFEYYGYFSTTTALGSFVPSVVGGHGTGATLSIYFSWDDGTNYYYEVYSDSYGSGYAPEIMLSPASGSYSLYSAIEENNTLRINYYDSGKTNLYTVAPSVSISFGGATATAILEGTSANGQNTAIGYQSLFNNANGRENTGIGHQALYNSTGNSNLGLGFLAGNTLTTGSNNVFIGKNAGKGITTGSGNLFIGNGSNLNLNSALNNSVIIADGNGSPRIFTGSNGNMKVGYGVNFNDDGFKLDVNGTIRSTSIIQASRAYVKDVSMVSSNSTFYHDFLLSVFDTNTLQLRAVVDANNYPSVFSVDKPTASMTFYAPVKGVNAVNSNEFVTLGQLNEKTTIDDVNDVLAIAGDQNTSNSSLVRRSSFGSINASYFNMSSPTVDAVDFTDVVTTNNDGFLRRNSFSALKSKLSLSLQDVATVDNSINRDIRFSNQNNIGLKWGYNGDLSSLYYNGASNGNGKLLLDIGDDNLSTQGFQIRGLSYDNTVNELAYFGANGNVGIGTTTPQEKLAVNGKIKAKEVKVQPEGWADYVFEDTYKSLTLKEIAAFIKLNKHLPEVPSAREVAQNGIELGEMNKILLKKIEELTLHLIAKEQQLIETNSRLDKLTQQVEKLIEKK